MRLLRHNWHQEKKILWCCCWMMMLCAFLLGRCDFTDAFVVQRGWQQQRDHSNQQKTIIAVLTSPTPPPSFGSLLSHRQQRNSQSILWATSELDNIVIREEKITTVEQLEDALVQNPHSVPREAFHNIFRSILLAKKSTSPWCSTADVAKVNQLFRTMQQQLPVNGQRPTRETYELVQQVWLLASSSSSTSSPEGGEATVGSTRDPETWLYHLRSLWNVYHDAVVNGGGSGGIGTDADADAKQLLVELAPRRSTYFNTFKGLLQCHDGGSGGKSSSSSFATRIIDDAEALFDEMLHHSAQQSHPTVIHPDILCANQVLMIYNKFGSPERGEYFLHRLEKLYRQQEPVHQLSSLRPNRYTYSLVLDAIAKSQTPSAAERAEDLLNAMLVSATSAATAATAAAEENGGGGGGGGVVVVVVEPDTTVYNTVLNAWARSKSPQAVERAEGIMQTMHMRRRAGLSNAQPDIVTYNTMLNILARSARGYHGARKLVDQMEKNHRYHHRRRRNDDKNNNTNDSDNDTVAVAPNVVSYNILIKALADDVSVTNATEKALAIVDAIRTISSDDDEGVVGDDDDAPRQKNRRRLNCALDSVTYSSVLRVMSRDSSKEQPQYAEQAMALLHELETAYDASNDPALAPNSILYTLTISAIARSGTGPERAEKIIERMEERYRSGTLKSRPDHICYNALINAYAWSDVPGRSVKSYEVFLKMKELFQSYQVPAAKPDIITCNSVLTACAHEVASSPAERNQILRCAVETYEFFRTNAPKFGRLDHITFDRALKAIGKHLVDDDQKRWIMAESIFAECCLRGHVSVLVVTTLHTILPWDRLSQLLGGALMSKEGEPLHFSWKLLPADYSKYAPRPSTKSFSRGSHVKPQLRHRPSSYRLAAEDNQRPRAEK